MQSSWLSRVLYLWLYWSAAHGVCLLLKDWLMLSGPLQGRARWRPARCGGSAAAAAWQSLLRCSDSFVGLP